MYSILNQIKRTAFFAVFLLFTTNLKAQNIGINATGATPNTSAGLDIDFSNKGLLIPRIALTSTTDITTIASPATSSLVYNTNAAITSGSGAGYYYYDGAKWVRLFDSNLPIKAWELLGNAGTSPATNFLGTTDNQPLVFKTNNTEVMRILSNGNVGIGTNNPSQRLNVDPQGGGGILIGNPDQVSGNYTSLRLSISALTNGYSSIESISAAGSAYGNLGLNPIAGNVGIGTNNPVFKLEIKGDLGVINKTAGNRFLVSEISETLSGVGQLTSIVTGQQRGVLLKDRPALQGGLWLLGGDYTGNNSIGAIGMGWVGDTGTMWTSSTTPSAITFSDGSIRFMTDNARVVGAVYYDYANSEKMRVTPTGNVGIGTTIPAYTLQVAGNIGAPGFINTSDQRLKNNILPSKYGLKEIMQLKPVTFQWNKDNDGTRVGFIAQEVRKIIPEIVSEGKDKDKTLGIYYN